MQFGGINTQVDENSGSPVQVCRLDLKTKQFEASPDDIKLTIMLRANDAWSFRSVTLLSREFSLPAWIALSFNII
jgi:hypothetical protein